MSAFSARGIVCGHHRPFPAAISDSYPGAALFGCLEYSAQVAPSHHAAEKSAERVTPLSEGIGNTPPPGFLRHANLGATRSATRPDRSRVRNRLIVPGSLRWRCSESGVIFPLRIRATRWSFGRSASGEPARDTKTWTRACARSRPSGCGEHNRAAPNRLVVFGARNGF